MGKYMVRMVCYHSTVPVVYNPGREDEVVCNDFLAYFSDKPLAELEEEVAKINAGLIPVLQNGCPADIEHRTYFASEQELEE